MTWTCPGGYGRATIGAITGTGTVTSPGYAQHAAGLRATLAEADGLLTELLDRLADTRRPPAP